MWWRHMQKVILHNHLNRDNEEPVWVSNTVYVRTVQLPCHEAIRRHSTFHAAENRAAET